MIVLHFINRFSNVKTENRQREFHMDIAILRPRQLFWINQYLCPRLWLVTKFSSFVRENI
jgi:hypothetical protein